MADILHRVGTTATPDHVYGALTTLDGLAEPPSGGQPEQCPRRHTQTRTWRQT